MKPTIKILIPLAQGFEEIEAVTLIDLLRRAGFEVITVSISQQLQVLGAHGIELKANKFLLEQVSEKIDAFILPGGMPGSLNLKNCEVLEQAAKVWVQAGVAYGAICAAPTALAAWGLLEGKRCTCYPGFEHELGNGRYEMRDVVIDERCLTSRGVGTAIEYACGWVRFFKGKAASDQLKQKILVQR